MIRTALFAVIAAAAMTACGPTKYIVQSTPIAVGADADIFAEAVKDQGLVRLTVHAHNLPPPPRIKEGLTHYVVWQRKDNSARWNRVAALQYDESAREGHLAEATVAQLSFDLIITAEGAADVEVPSSELVFAQHVEP